MLSIGIGKRLLVWFLFYYARKTMVERNEERQEIGLRGKFSNIVQELRIEDTNGYKELMRMAHEQFLEILTATEPSVTKRQVIGGHKVISPAE